MVSLAEQSERVEPEFSIQYGGIQQCPVTAVTRIEAEHVSPALFGQFMHLMPVSVVDRDEFEPAADLVVYHKVTDEGGFIYIDALDVKRAACESPRKPMAFDRIAELRAEFAAAKQLLNAKV